MPPLVSVVIPCYLQVRFVRDAVESALAQAYPSVEVIVINDGSPDARAMEQVLAPFRDRVSYLTQENRGLAGARNRGLEACTGEYVTFLDADDRLLSNSVSAGVQAISTRPACALVWGLRRSIDEHGDPSRSQPGRLDKCACYAELLKTNIIGPPVGVLFRRSALVAIGGFSSSVPCAEDYDAYLRLAQRHEIHCHGEMVGEYRLHDANMSANAQRMLAGVLQALHRQASWVEHDAELQRALRSGRRDARERYDWEPRLQQLGIHTRAGRWMQATVDTVALFSKYPRKSLPVLFRRLRKALLPARP